MNLIKYKQTLLKYRSMDMLQSLKTYTKAQKGTGTNFTVAGIVIAFLTAVVIIVSDKSILLTGFKWGGFSAGIIMILIGLIYRGYCDIVHKKAQTIYSKDKIEFVKTEHRRMQKVEKDLLGYQIAFSLVIVLSIAVSFFVHSKITKGVLYAVAMLFAGMLMVENMSRSSIKNYTETLKEEFNKINRFN